MKAQWFALVLTAINLLILLSIFVGVRPVTAKGVAPVLRGRALERYLLAEQRISGY